MTQDSVLETGEGPVGVRHELHMIGNAHMDPVWIWDWREGYGEVWATFRSALDRLRENDHFTFTASSAAYYSWIERNDPKMFVEIENAIAAGRWCVVGGMWIEPDCNIPSGESICRQLLLGQRYFRRAFGRTASVGYNVDSFGHAAGLANLLVEGGLTSYVMMRPEAHERELPAHAFQWTDPRGASIVTYRIPFNYETESLNVLLEKVHEITSLSDTEGIPQMCFFGIGNHGGGPTKRMLEAIDDLRTTQDHLRYSDPEHYFRALASISPLLDDVAGELQHHAVGCYSVSAWVKAANQKGETALLDAETLDAVASRLVRRDSSIIELGHAWEQLALCQFHDILAGTSSEFAYRTIHSRFGYVDTVADEVTTHAIYEISHQVDTRVATIGVQERESFWTESSDAAIPFLVYNPLAWKVRQTVRATRHAARVLDSSGNEIVSQQVISGESTAYRSHTLFSVDLEPLGYEVYWLQGSSNVLVPDVSSSASEITSSRFRAKIDSATGAITSLFDLATSTELVGEGGIRPVVLSDETDTWSHGLSRYEGEPLELNYEGSEVIETGPVRSLLRLRFRLGESSLIEDIILHESSPFVQLRLRAKWRTPQCVVKLVLPWHLTGEVTTVAGAAYSYQERSVTGGEETFQGWLDTYDVDANVGVGITTDHLYGYDASQPEIRLTVLRNPLAADHGRKWAVRVGEDFELTDSRDHDVSVNIIPHDGDWRAAGLPLRADEHRRPPVVVAETYHAGVLPGRGNFLRLEPADLAIVRSVKRAENGEGVVLRLVEALGQSTTGTLSGDLLGRTVAVSLDPYEVATMLISDDPGVAPCLVSVAELDFDNAEVTN